MLTPKVLVASIFVLLLVFHHVQAIHINQEAGNAVSETSYRPRIDCEGACSARCKRACGTCCARCNCVLPGTYGNLEPCPCYANMATRHHKRKCPQPSTIIHSERYVKIS